MEMPVDFCKEIYGTQASCDTVSSDGYEVSNLVKNTSGRTRKIGFLAEHFIKPPVTITFQFQFPVEISQIVLHTAVGAQKSQALEILARFTVKQDKIAEHQVAESSDLQRIGWATVAGTNYACICFKNRRYHDRSRYSFQSSEVKIPSSAVIQDFNSSGWEYVSKASHVAVRITQTVGRCVPALGSVEIWGQPARETKPEILHKFMQLHKQEVPKKEVKICNQKPKMVRKNSELNNSDITTLDGVSVPSDFIDPITCEIMVLPLLLPSGHNIDKSTLDKHSSAESTWGRSPSDPFTGVVFNSKSKPVSNPHLKARIDQFLLENGNKLKSVARTVGSNALTSDKSSNVRISSLVKQPSVCDLKSSTSHHLPVLENIQSKLKPTEIHTSNKGAVSTLLQNINISSTSNIRKRNKICSATEIVNLTSRDNEKQTVQINTKKPKMAVHCKHSSVEPPLIDLTSDKPSHENTNETFNMSADSHEDTVKDSLEDAMFQTLNGLRSFTNFSSNESNSTNQTKCVKCGSGGKCDLFYQLPCKHVICRPCLLQLNCYSCMTCFGKFSKSDLIRIFK